MLRLVLCSQNLLQNKTKSKTKSKTLSSVQSVYACKQTDYAVRPYGFCCAGSDPAVMKGTLVIVCRWQCHGSAFGVQGWTAMGCKAAAKWVIKQHSPVWIIVFPSYKVILKTGIEQFHCCHLGRRIALQWLAMIQNSLTLQCDCCQCLPACLGNILQHQNKACCRPYAQVTCQCII